MPCPARGTTASTPGGRSGQRRPGRPPLRQLRPSRGRARRTRPPPASTVHDLEHARRPGDEATARNHTCPIAPARELERSVEIAVLVDLDLLHGAPGRPVEPLHIDPGAG